MELLLSPNDAAARAGVSRNYLMRQCKAGTGPQFVRPSPRRTLFSKAEIDQWVKSWARSPTQEKE
jgi:predicted DNA-binding transcriptional regulator AlpA